LLFPATAAAVAGPEPTQLWLVRVIDAPGSDFSSSAGLTYSPEAGAFLVPQAAGAGRVLVISPFGDALGGVEIPAIGDPINVAFDAAGSRLLLFDTASRQLVVVQATPDGRPEASRFSRLDALPFGVEDPQGMTVDVETGTLFVLDSRARALVSIAPEALRGSAAPAGVTRLDLEGLGGAPLRGVAFDPVTRQLYVLAPTLKRLYALTETGRVVGSHDLAHLPLSDPRGIAVAPSGDQTDDPAEMSLYLLEGGTGGEPSTSGAILEVSLTEAAVEAAAAPLVPSFLVNTIEASGFSPPSPDSAGLAYQPNSDHLLMSDSEVNEMSIFRDVNVWEASLAGDEIFETSSTTRFSGEPTGIAYDTFTGHYLISDDDADEVFDVDPGRDGRLGTSDDVITSLDTRDFGSSDPEGIALDSVRGRLFIADGTNSEIYEIDAGSNGRFDGVPPAGDDQLVNNFDTESLGIRDPEGVEFDAASGDLYVVGRPADRVAQITTGGVLVRMIDTSEANATKPAGIALAPGSLDSSVTNLYIAARGVDNGSDPSENDGRIYEMAFDSAPPPPPQDGVVDVRVASDSDDAEESASGSVSLGSSDLEMVFDGSDQTVGMRFAQVFVPRGALILKAYVQFTVDEATSVETSLTIEGEAIGDAPTFSSTSLNVSSRDRTQASVGWWPPPWGSAGDAGVDQRTPDISSIIQEIVRRPDWSSGQSLVILVSGFGERVAESHDGTAAAAPLLHVEFATDGGACGNGVRDPGEECDGSDLGGATCGDGGCTGGTPSCSSACTLDFSSCSGCPICGNGLKEGGEECDGADLGGEDCGTLGFYCQVGGGLGCNADCTFDAADCIPGACGDGSVQADCNEVCDGSNLAGESCQSQGFGGGDLACVATCLDFDTSGCGPCNDNGVCEVGEDCDNCPGDCLEAPSCGNGICETANGEDCLSCPEDCNGLQRKKPSLRFCCGSGAGTNPVGCSDARCGGPDSCLSAPAVPSCCGDATCEGAESALSCAVDCAP
jgi:DNA-binding beta-propeller fold protein YncE